MCIHIFYMYQTSTCIKSPYCSWKKTPIWMSPSKTHHIRRKRLFCTWTISSTWSWPCFSRDVGCRITSKPSGFNPSDHTIHQPTFSSGPRIPQNRNETRGFYKASQYNSRPIVYNILLYRYHWYLLTIIPCLNFKIGPKNLHLFRSGFFRFPKNQRLDPPKKRVLNLYSLYDAGFWDFQTTRFEIPWFLGFFNT